MCIISPPALTLWIFTEPKQLNPMTSNSSVLLIMMGETSKKVKINMGMNNKVGLNNK